MPLHYKKRLSKNTHLLSNHLDMDMDIAHKGNCKDASEKVDSYSIECTIECCISYFQKIAMNIWRIFCSFSKKFIENIKKSTDNCD